LVPDAPPAEVPSSATGKQEQASGPGTT